MIIDYLKSNWTTLMGNQLPENISVSAISSCAESHGNIIFLVFLNSDKTPTYFIKLSRNPDFAYKIENEFRGLKQLSYEDSIRPFIPDPINMGSYHGQVFVIQSYVGHLSFAKIIVKNGLSDKGCHYINEAIDLLAKINSTPIKKSKEVVQEPFLSIGDILKNHHEQIVDFGISKEIIGSIAKAEDSINQIKMKHFIHGDYWQNNIMIDPVKETISGVIDWEFCSAEKKVPSDIIWFLINLAGRLHPTLFKKSSLFIAFIWFFFKKGDHSIFVKNFYNRYLEKMNCSYIPFVELLQLSLTEMAFREYHAYGMHGVMDELCKEMLVYTYENKKNIKIQ